MPKKTCHNCGTWLTMKEELDTDKTNPRGFCLGCQGRLTRARHADPTNAGLMLWKLWQLRMITIAHG